MLKKFNYFARRVAAFYSGNFKNDGVLGIARVTVGLLLTLTAPIATRVGSKNCHCPCCGWRGSRFLPFLAVGYFRFNTLCPNCGSAPRHRSHRILYEDVLNFAGRSGRLLYFAPERNVVYFQQIQQLSVNTSNFPGGEADFHIDIMDIPFEDDSWDHIVCHHVIEHLSDDKKGLMEFNRILKPGGMAIVSVAVNARQATTVEYGKPNPLEHDHYYRYGADFIGRIPGSFNIQKYRVLDSCSLASRQSMALEDDDVFVLCKFSENEGVL